MKKKRIGLLLIFSLIFLFGHSQIKKSKWTNKNKGAVIISYTYIGYYPDSTITGIPKKLLAGISVRLFELTENGCTSIEGTIKINGKEYFAYDSTNFADSEGFKQQDNFFGIWVREGEYTVSASSGKKYYPVKAVKFFLTHGASYQFVFYLIRKDKFKDKSKT